MSKLAATLVSLTLFVACAQASARPALTLRHGRAAITQVLDENEHPSTLRLLHCRRLTPYRVRCAVKLDQIEQPTETKVGTITELTGFATATLLHHERPAFDYIKISY
jgi:hypothetical protein